jgi:hypothetical protein
VTWRDVVAVNTTTTANVAIPTSNRLSFFMMLPPLNMQWLKPLLHSPDSFGFVETGRSKSQVKMRIYCTKVSIDTLVLIGVLIALGTDTKVR